MTFQPWSGRIALASGSTMKLSFLITNVVALLWGVFSIPSSLAQSEAGSAASAPRDYSFTISTAQPWTDTGVDLQGGELLEISATARSGGCDPNGMSGSAQENANRPVPSASTGALIAKLQEQGEAVLVGSNHQLRADQPGHL